MKLKKIAALTAATGGLILAGAGAAMADASAEGSTWNSPGVGSGNDIQVPVHAPINITGNGVDVIGVLDWVLGNRSGN